MRAGTSDGAYPSRGPSSREKLIAPDSMSCCQTHTSEVSSADFILRALRSGKSFLVMEVSSGRILCVIGHSPLALIGHKSHQTRFSPMSNSPA